MPGAYVSVRVNVTKRIANSYIDAWDDAVCPKASWTLGKRRATEHLVVANCVLRTSCSHFKFGTESTGDLRDVSVSNCVMLRRDIGRKALGGINIESVDGANIASTTMWSRICSSSARGSAAPSSR